MEPNAAGEFVFKVADVFSLTGRGTTLVGEIESGVVRTGDDLKVRDGERVIFVGPVTVDRCAGRVA